MTETVQKILVTGSSGTIGTRLCEKLLEEGYDVQGIDWKHNKWNKEIDERTVQCDLRDTRRLEKISGEADMLIHLAANARVYNLVVDPSLARDNIETAFNVLEFARRRGIQNALFASSREVYGNTKESVHAEHEINITLSASPYTASKIAAEAMVHAWRQCYGMNFIILRFSQVYGMYDGSDRLIPLFVSLAKRNKDLTIWGREKVLDFTYIDDCVSGITKAVENFEKNKNETFNIASGKGISIGKVAQLIKKYTRSTSKVVVKKNRIGEVVKFTADISKARKKLGYEPRVPIQEGIRKTVDWYDKNFQ